MVPSPDASILAHFKTLPDPRCGLRRRPGFYLKSLYSNRPRASIQEPQVKVGVVARWAMPPSATGPD
jgi:hypothetical protein